MPNLVVIFGPPASGKAAIGHELAARLGYRFFHNHLTANPVAALFGWVTPQFGRVVDEVRDLLFGHAAADASMAGVVFTFVWDMELPDDAAVMQRAKAAFEAGGGRVHFVELLASLEARLAREGTPFRARHKPNQEDVEAARERQRGFAARYRMNTEGVLPFGVAGSPGGGPHLVIDTEALSPEQAAAEIQRWLAKPAPPAPVQTHLSPKRRPSQA